MLRLIILQSLLLSCLLRICAASLPVQQTILQEGPGTYQSISDTGFRKYVELVLAQLKVPGLSIAVIDRGNITAEGYGYSVLPDTKATPDTLYYTGSTTKAFTAAAVAKLVSDGKLKWQSKLADLMPEEFVLQDLYTTNSITVEDALSHRSGMPRHDLSYGNSSTADVVRSLRYLPLTAEPRTTFQYCNTMLATAGYLVSKVTGQDLGKILHDWFWQPIGMKSTFLDLNSALVAEDKLARGYYWVENDDNGAAGYYVPEPYLDLAPLAGAGAIISSVNDYAVWMKAILETSPALHRASNKSPPITSQIYHDILSPRTFVDEIVIPNSDPNAFIDLPHYALGWFSTRFAGRRIIAHGGSLTGFGAELFILPDDDFGIITMGNTVATSNIAGQLIASIILQAKFRSKMDHSSLEFATQHIHHLSGPAPRAYSHLTSEICPRREREREMLDRNKLPETPVRSNNKSPYTGIYSHPAYGTMQVFEAPDGQNVLHIVPSYHIWAFEMIFHPSEEYRTERPLFFDIDFWSPHGPFRPDAAEVKARACGQSVSATATCKDKVVWEKSPYLNSGIAYFQPGPDGKLDKLGIQLSPEMVARAERESLSWDDSLIWFEKA